MTAIELTNNIYEDSDFSDREVVRFANEHNVCACYPNGAPAPTATPFCGAIIVRDCFGEAESLVGMAAVRRWLGY